MVTTTLKRIVYPCWRPSVVENAGEKSSREGDVNGRVDGLLWYKDSGRHFNGSFSMAVIQANNVLEDHCQLESGPMSLVESGPQGTFVGIYDGHAGADAAQFISNQLFENMKKGHQLEGLGQDLLLLDRRCSVLSVSLHGCAIKLGEEHD